VGGAVTFDFHNTLVQSERWFELEVRDLPAAFLRWRAARDGTPLPAATEEAARLAYRRLRGQIQAHGDELPAERCVALVLDEIGLPADGREIAAAVEALMQDTLAGAVPMPGAVETVAELADRGVPLAVVSSAVYHPFIDWALTRVGIRDAFAQVVSSASAGFYKSRTEIFDCALSALGAQARVSVHVGDSFKYDVQTARRAGMRTVWLSRDPAPDDGPPPDLILAHLQGATHPILTLRDRAP
jgi:HAD superfamily hydrolase (TIGR01509 family)